MGASLFVAHSRHWDFVAGSSAAQEACHYFRRCRYNALILLPVRGQLHNSMGQGLIVDQGLIVIQWAVALKDP